jgi:hypothetical protein
MIQETNKQNLGKMTKQEALVQFMSHLNSTLLCCVHIQPCHSSSYYFSLSITFLTMKIVLPDKLRSHLSNTLYSTTPYSRCEDDKAKG